MKAFGDAPVLILRMFLVVILIALAFLFFAFCLEGWREGWKRSWSEGTSQRGPSTGKARFIRVCRAGWSGFKGLVKGLCVFGLIVLLVGLIGWCVFDVWAWVSDPEAWRLISWPVVVLFLGVAGVVAWVVGHYVEKLSEWLHGILAEHRQTTDEILENLSGRLERMEETLEEIRAQPEQEKLRQELEKAHDLTLREVRLLKKGDIIGLIEATDSDRAHPFRCFEYRHDQLDEATKEVLPGSLDLEARRSRGFRRLNPDQQQQMLEKKSQAALDANQAIKVHLEEEEKWTPYDFLVGDSRSETDREAHVKCSWNFNEASPVAAAQAGEQVGRE